MELKWIEDFLSLAKTHSFSRAAEERNITQPAISRRIRALEAWVGTQLVDRSAYPTQLTPAGKLFRAHADDCLRQMLDVRAMLRDQVAMDGMVLQIVAGHTLSLNYLPHWLKQVQAKFGEISAWVISANLHDAVLALVEGGCDLILCYHHPELPILLDPKCYTYLSLGSETVLPVSVPGRDGRAAFALPGSKSAPVRYLSYTYNSYFGRVVDLILRKAQQPHFLRRYQESDMSDLLKRMALEGYGVVWLPENSVARELADGKLAPAAGNQWSLQLEIRLYRALDNRNPTLNRLWTHLARTPAIPFRHKDATNSHPVRSD